MWLRKHLPTKRRLIQLYTALLYNAYVKGFIKGDIYTGSSKMLCVPGFNCYSCPGAVGACPLGALQNAVASSGSRAPTYVIGILMLYGLMLGRTICGFLCPVGLLQELLHKLPTPKVPKGWGTRLLSWFKYVLLAVFVIGIPLWYAQQRYPLPAFCKYICPAGTFEGALGLLSNPVNADKFSMLGGLFTGKFLIMLAVAGACVFMYRAFCRVLCPLGAIYGLFSKVAVIGVKVDLSSCINCGKCVKHCKMDVCHVGDHECIHCGECMDVCPTQAIAFQAGKYVIASPTMAHKDAVMGARIRLKHACAWCAALLVLMGALVLFNQPDDLTSVEAPYDIGGEDADLSGVVIGSEVGMYAPGFSAPRYGEDTPFVLAEHRGKKVILNFWATWCTPCCAELPYFDEIHCKYGDRVSVVAIHSDLVTDDVAAYLASFDYKMPFAFDETGEIIKAYGGSTMLPQTVIIDESGVIIYNAVGSLTLEKLEALLGLTANHTNASPNIIKKPIGN